MKPITLLAAVLLLTAGGVSSDSAATAYGEDHLPPLKPEHICGAALYPRTFRIEVMSNGCTDVEDFVFVTERVGPSEFEALLIRLEPDFCRGPARTVTLTFERAKLGLDGIDIVHLQNPMCGTCPPRW